MREYINPNMYTVHLSGPSGEEIVMAPREKKILNEYYDKYRIRGFIKLTSNKKTSKILTSKIRNRLILKPKHAESIQQIDIKSHKRTQRQVVSKAIKISKATRKIPPDKKQVVGKKLVINASELLYRNLSINPYPISNNIGIGIMSYNRVDSLRRLIDSIMKYTDLTQTTVFVSDDNSQKPEIQTYLTELQANSNIIIIKNKERTGIACNSNRLLRCLNRFKYGIILNDDIEVLRPGWDSFYPDILRKTGMHHMIFRQPGIYGAKDNFMASNIGGVDLRTIYDKPHGAILAFTREMLETCGYFNESYGIYGMEHVDWSKKPYEFGMQPDGYWDASESENYFIIHDDKSAVENRIECLGEARKLFSTRATKIKIGSTERSKVPEITYIVPFRNTGRADCIEIVVANLRAQRYPVIHLILVEQDNATAIDINKLHPVQYHLVPATNPLFNKSLAFNLGVSKALSDKLILHDADIMVQGNYTSKISEILDTSGGCHLGKTVVYANKESTNRVCNNRCVDTSIKCERVVGYFEGGSIACTKQTYWKVGAFCQDFYGYGCEDCDFYQRLSASGSWQEDRVFDFFHLWHDRVQYWNAHHDKNKDKAKLLCSMSMDNRVKTQHERLIKQGWEEFLRRYTNAE